MFVSSDKLYFLVKKKEERANAFPPNSQAPRIAPRLGSDSCTPQSKNVKVMSWFLLNLEG